jgi:hypothetical protein
MWDSAGRGRGDTESCEPSGPVRVPSQGYVTDGQNPLAMEGKLSEGSPE